MRKLIHSNFELDLQNFKLVDIEQNSIFADSFFVKTIYPFDINLTDDLDVAFGFISSYTINPQTIYECKYCHFDKVEDATLEILEIIGQKLSCTITYGLEGFPNWDKKLNELSLQNFQLPDGTSIYQHANTIVSQTWPLVNYNFPMIHTDKINTDSAPWEDFEKIINKRVNGLFVTNAVGVDNIPLNRNIMQPMPYWLHVLQRGCFDGGFTLAGEILDDVKIKNLVLFGDVDYFTKMDVIYYDDTDLLYAPNLTTFNERSWTKEILIAQPGRYKISGSVNLGLMEGVRVKMEITRNNQVIAIRQGNLISSNPPTYDNTFEIDVEFECFNNNNCFIFIKRGRAADSSLPYEDIIPSDLTISLVTLYDINNLPMPIIRNLNEVNLPKACPDITFGEFVNVLKNWFNYGFDVVGNVVFMNKITNAAVRESSISLEKFEIEFPLRKFSKGISFLHKFETVENKEYLFKSVFQNLEGFVTDNFKVTDKTNVIEVKGLPLPLKTFAEITTAHAFENNNAKVYAVRYNGLFRGRNVSTDSSDLHLENIHLEYWFNWLLFRINAVPFKWQFLSYFIDLNQLNVRSTVYAYENFHLVKSIQRTEIEPDIFDYDIELESLI